jgi:hypothetical protein
VTGQPASSLFFPCPLPGCREGLTDDPAVPCADCLAVFGTMLRPAGTPSPRRSAEETLRLLAGRDEAVRDAYAARLPPEAGTGLP